MVSSAMAVLLRQQVSARIPRPRKTVRKIPAFDVQLFLDSAGLGGRGAFRGKEIIFSQGDPAKNVMYIQEGGVKLSVINTAGKEALVAILGAGDFAGNRAYGAPGHPKKVLPKVSQEMLAEMIGTTRTRVNFFMNKLRKLGFIQYNGEFHVNDSLLNVVLHD